MHCDDDVTVKRLIDDTTQAPRLKAENSDFEDILLQPARDNIVLEGEAVGVIRAF